MGVVKEVSFSEQEVRVFGDTAVSRGRRDSNVTNFALTKGSCALFTKRYGIGELWLCRSRPLARNS